MLFQVTQVGRLQPEPLWPYVLALHVNPNSLQEQFTKNKSVTMTRGGFVEFMWPDDLDALSADSTTGAFIGPDSGLTSDSANDTYRIGRGAGVVRPFRGRHGTLAWERTTDLLELFRSNGQLFNGSGMPVLRSQIMCIYDRGIYYGWFSNFEVVETAELPYQFQVSWEFKVTETVYKLPTYEPMPENIEETSRSDMSNASVEKFLLDKSNAQPVDPSVQAVLKDQSQGTDAQELAIRASTRDKRIVP